MVERTTRVVERTTRVVELPVVTTEQPTRVVINDNQHCYLKTRSCLIYIDGEDNFISNQQINMSTD